MKNDTPDRTRVFLRAFQRIDLIWREIASGRYPRVRDLAGLLEVDERTVKRAIASIRDEFLAPIRNCRKNKGYYFEDPGWSMPMRSISEGDLLAFFIAENALRLTGQTPEALQLKQALAKIATMLPVEVSVNLATLGRSVGFQNLPFVFVEPRLLQRIARAAIAQQTVEFDYFSPHSGERTHRTADVHLLHNFAGDWFAVSFDHEKQDFRDFHVGRLSGFEEKNQYFIRRPNFDSEEYLKRGFFMTRGGRLTTVVIHFDAYQAQWIRERNSFHPDEVREELPDGSLRMSFKVGTNGLEAVARFCVTYSGHCRVEKPMRLREIVLKKLKEGIELNQLG